MIDHLGKPPVGGSIDDHRAWRRLATSIAAHPESHAKVSGLYRAGGPLGSWTTDDIRPFVEDALELFGPERLMYGSDWPVSPLAGGYERTWEALSLILARLDDGDRARVLGTTASAFYRLHESVG